MKHESTDSGERGLWVATALVVTAIWQVLTVVTGDGTGAGFLFRDSEPYLYFNRVELLEAGRGWFDQLDLRANAPEGHRQHWTRPMDLVLWAGAKVLSIGLEFREALAWWGAIWSPLLHLVLGGAIVWALWPMGRGLAVVAAATGMVQAPTLRLFRWGAASHHSWIVVLWIAALGLIVREVTSTRTPGRNAAIFGAICGLAVWVNLSGLVFVLVLYAVLGLLWLRGNRSVARFGAVGGLVTTVVVTGGAFVEFGPGFWSVRKTDVVSLPFIVAFGVAAAFWAVLWAGDESIFDEESTALWWERLGWAAAAAAGALAILGLIVPELFEGPCRRMYEEYREIRLSRLGAHISPVVTAETTGEAIREAVLYFGIPGCGLVVAARRLVEKWNTDREAVWLVVTAVLVAFAALTIWQRRWVGYLALSGAVCYAPGVQTVLRRLANRRMPDLAAAAVRPAAIIALLLWPPVLAVAADAAVGAFDGSAASGRNAPMEGRSDVTREKCDIRPVARWLEDRDRRPDIALLPVERGGEWIFRTGTGAVAIGNHRPQSGFLLTQEVFRATDHDRARRLLRTRGVDLVLVCPSNPRFRWVDEEGGRTLYRTLLERDSVPGLHRVAEGRDVGRWLIYAVQ